MSKINKPKYKFIDLFSGIGGFHIALHELGCECVFASEWDKYARKTYQENFQNISPQLFELGNFAGDITKVDENKIPDFDILCGGFPCQPFSLAGVSKKNAMGRKHGFDDETQGTLFFNIKAIIKKKKPAAFFLENVKNLISHDKGRTFQIIKSHLDELGYVINYTIVDAAKWVPQHRERIFIVGYNKRLIDISKDEIVIPKFPFRNYKYPELSAIIKSKISGYTLGPGTWETLKRHKLNHERKGNGFGYGILKLPIKKGTVTRTISARYHKDGAEILIEQPGKRPRKLTIEEAMQLQGYNPDKFTFPVSLTQAYKQIGNSVAIPAIKATAKEIISILELRYKRK